MQQQALLHRRQRIDVLDVGGGHAQAVELFLRHRRQRKVRRRDARSALGAEVDQRLQDVQEALRQRGDRILVMDRRAVGEADLERAAQHGRIDRQPRAAAAIGRALLSRALAREPPTRIGIERLVELTQIVEGHLGIGPVAQPRAFRRQVPQQAITQPLARHPAKLFLDRFDALAQVRATGREPHRVKRGEPAHRARHVERFADVLAAMALQLDQHAIAPGPFAQRA
ncbi:hypothetical protein D3C86_1055060 [compost metagenome]